ncbi:S27A3 protein, partial [Herpetotheres cachinnans]|nr:S27A3 protein [Herpetotheres cachinnans]
MAALVLRPGCRLDGPALYRHVEQLLPPYAWPRFLRLQVTGWAGGYPGDVGCPGGPQPTPPPSQERLAMTETFKQQKVRLAQEGFDPARVPDPLFLLDETTKAYVPLGPALWEGVLDGRLRI